MAIDACNPCNCSGAFVNDVVSFRIAVLNALCNISSTGIPVSPIVASAVVTETLATVGVASSVVLAANATRKGGWVKNISNEYIWVSFSATATAVKPTQLAPGVVLPFVNSGVLYTGVVSAICPAGNNSLEVVEF